MNEVTFEEYQNALNKKEETRKALLEVRFQMEINKFNNEENEKLKIKEQELMMIIKKSISTICSYELNNNIERRKK